MLDSIVQFIMNISLCWDDLEVGIIPISTLNNNTVSWKY